MQYATIYFRSTAGGTPNSALGAQGTLMAKLLGLIVALVVFFAWLSVVGNPHVVETVIGLVLAVIAGFWVFLKARKFGAPPK